MAAVLVSALVGTLLSLVVPGVAQAWEQVGAACPDVLVIGARGSDEQPQKNGGVDPSQYKADRYNGMGIVNYTVYQRLAATHPQLQIDYEGVQYAAEPVLSLTGPSLLLRPDLYSDNAWAGARWMAQEVSLIDARCNHSTKFVLAGYSQGAWVVHRTLFLMSDRLRMQVVGVTLFGDPLYVQGQTINRVNNRLNIFNGSAWPVDRDNAGVPEDMVAKTGNYCHTLDPVCQFGPTNLAPLALLAHLNYAPGDAVKAADFVSPNLPTPTASANLAYGRNAPTYTSYPNDPTPTSKWVASAQGDGGLNPKGEVTSLKGRAAVQETFGITRVRIYDVTLQRLLNGAWQTVAQRTTDVVNESSRAYAVTYTPRVAYCRFDPSLTRTYRVVQNHGVRRVDNIVANRTTVSKTFTARALWNDPTCPKGAWNAGIFGALEQWPKGETREVSTPLQWVSDVGPAQDVSALVQFGDGLVVEEAPAGWARLDPTPGSPLHNSFQRKVASWPANLEEEPVWTVTADVVGSWHVAVSVHNQAPSPSVAGQDTVNVEVVEPPVE
jgi:hypothetical protein